MTHLESLRLEIYMDSFVRDLDIIYLPDDDLKHSSTETEAQVRFSYYLGLLFIIVLPRTSDSIAND